MYIQSSDRPIPPKNYSGNAISGTGEFRFPGALPEAPPDAPPEAEPRAPAELPPQPLTSSPPPPPEPEAEVPAVQVPEPSEPEAIPAGAPHHGGPLSRFPFLSTFLPPPRGKEGKSALFPDWVLIGAVALLFLSEGDNDILPFLLLLLLWD